MSGGPWVAWIMLAAAPLMLVYARLHDPKGWARAWANVATVAGYWAEWLRWRLVPWLHAGLVIVAWWLQLRVRAVRFRHIRQETRR